MLGHPFDDGSAVIVERSVETTAASLGRDAGAYKKMFSGLVHDWPSLERAVLGPPAIPRHPFTLARFGLKALRPAIGLATSLFAGDPARALLAGNAAHGMLPLNRVLTGGIGLTLCALCHIAGWPVPRGGAQRISDALAGYFKSLGGEIVTDARVDSIDKIPAAKIVLCDLSPRPLLRIAGHRLPLTYRTKLERYRYGMGVFKVDWALSSPIPWSAAGCRRAGTVHLGGSLDEIAASEQEAWNGRASDRPFVLLSQPTVVDPSRAPAGQHIAWAYCHVPSRSTVDMLDRIERQIERFAPGFRDCVLARSVRKPADIEADNPNFVGGDIAAGVTDLRQFFTRPTWRNYETPIRGLYLCSASTPPGVGVHGMCGYYAARLALTRA
jgi:phytoene dehydrogenase-like protein